MITLKDLQNYDIKNIDPQKIFQAFLQRKDLLINTIIVIVTVVVLLRILDDRNAQISKLTTLISALETKVKVISELDNSKSKLSKFLDELPQTESDTNMVINLINDMAIQHEIQISSFLPVNRESNDYSTKTTLQLTAKVRNYETLGKFIMDIENANANLLIESFLLTSGTKDLKRDWESTLGSPQPILVEVKIASLEIKK